MFVCRFPCEHNLLFSGTNIQECNCGIIYFQVRFLRTCLFSRMAAHSLPLWCCVQLPHHSTIFSCSSCPEFQCLPHQLSITSMLCLVPNSLPRRNLPHSENLDRLEALILIIPVSHILLVGGYSAARTLAKFWQVLLS